MKKAMKLLALILICMLPMMLSCGGGGGGGGTTETGATLTANNAPQATGAAIQSAHLILVTGAAEAVGPASAFSKTYSKDQIRKPPLRSILDNAISLSKAQRTKVKLHAQGSMPPTTETCSNGGTITMSATWTGPDDPTDPSHIVNFNATMTFNSCKEDTVTLNGTMSVAFEGSLGAPTKITISIPNFSYANTETNDNITITSLTMVVTNVTFSGEELIGGTLILTGAVSGSAGGDPISVECDNYTIVFSSGVTGETFYISGRLKPSCLGGWVTIATNTPIFVPAGADCPTAGEIVITSGGNSVKVVIASDSKITIYFNGTLVQTYNDCEEVDGLCVG